MSPAGIVMMYASEDERTCLVETLDGPGKYTVARFKTRRDALILDLSTELDVPSFFSEIPDGLEYDPRPRMIFLQQVARDISKPVTGDHAIHIDYVPTQVVTEYLRTVEMVSGKNIDGIRYKSSRGNGKRSLVLFATQNNMILPEKLRDSFYALENNRWIDLISSKVKKIA